MRQLSTRKLGLDFAIKGVCFCVLLSEFGCSSAPPISDYPPLIDLPASGNIGDLGLIPFIVVAKLVSIDKVGGPTPSRWRSNAPVQLFKAEIEIENVLAGNLAKGRQSIFYFVSQGSWSGPARLGLRGQGGQWKLGDREIFFLQSDRGNLRTVCDNLAHCVVTVFSGPHPSFVREPSRWVGLDLIDVILTRGEGCSDKQLAEAINQGSPLAYALSRDYATLKLRSLAKREGPLQTAACKALAQFHLPECGNFNQNINPGKENPR